MSNSLQHKLNNYEVNPPPAVWDKIATALDETDDTAEYPSKLYNMELAPPSFVWEQISSSLNEADPKVIPMRKKANSFYRYAVAAAVIGLVAFGITKWVAGNDQPTINDVAKASTTKSAGSVEKKNLTDPSVIRKYAGTEVINSPAETEHTESAQLPQSTRTHSRKIETEGISSALYSSEESTIDVSSNPIYAYEDHVPAIADRYIMLMTPEGKFIRMSKKWGNLVCCVSGEEQDADCKDQLKKWQAKIASSTLAPAPGNFMDILSLVSSLDDSNGL